MNLKVKLILHYTIFSLCTLLSLQSQTDEVHRKEIDALLNDWHQNAAKANFDKYFAAMTSDAVFIGTDAEEVWNKKEFMAYAKPHFDRGKTWNFTKVERNIYSKEHNNTAWFDELLKTQMGLCRGSGVVVFKDNKWLIQHYVLSIAIPNENVKEVTRSKAVHDSLYQLHLPN
ncbi:nuclear transport factor 2 family protein [Aquimarina sp. ERC-38]|uniref:nuclear transport factor 2 family protein n=1 Tax=Aquimarina sp. ERC-38 TaxID=2949996 RepID=UPI002246B804|nr:nuclear transport factor 2 family protein [Aquimarina sp. ERC-38]UZO82051.1 nuclear transport factor 2 family protein [Aquimarina sp. ERC-38]